MTTFVFDKLTDTNDWNVSSYDPAYDSFLTSPEESAFQGQSISPNGDYVAGTRFSNTAWVVKTTPAGSPSLVMKAVFDGVTWSGNDSGFVDQDFEAHCVDDAGFVWGTSHIWGTDTILPQPSRHRGVVGYIDPDDSSRITKAFSWANNPTGDADDFSIKRLSTYTLPDGTIKLIAIPNSSASNPNSLVFENSKGTATVTVHDTGGSWVPSFVFQDDNGDIWACGVPAALSGTIATVGFLRLTDVTGTSSYPASQAITVPAISFSAGSVRGYFAGGFFIGGWESDATADVGSATGTLLKIALDGSETVTTADVSADPLLLPNYPSVADPTFYFVQKANDTERDTAASGACRIFYHLTSSLTLTTSYDLDSWTAGDIGNDDTVTHDDVYTRLWSDGRQAFIGLRFQWMNEDGTLDTGQTREVADLFIYYFGETPTAQDSGEGGEADTATVRCWAYTLDGHDYYVMRLGASATLVYDRTTKTWAEWQSPNRTNWRAHIGGNWQGMTGTLADGASDVVAGDDATGVLWRLDPTKGRDDTTTTGDASFPRKVTGGIALSGRDVLACNALEVTCALGSPSQVGAAITLKTSDNLGQTWLNHGVKIISAGDYSAVVEWRGLGLARQPGRIFELSDDGATVRIGRATLR